MRERARKIRMSNGEVVGGKSLVEQCHVQSDGQITGGSCFQLSPVYMGGKESASWGNEKQGEVGEGKRMKDESYETKNVQHEFSINKNISL